MFRPLKVVKKSWGREEWIANSPMYCGKLLHVGLRQQCSLHYHERKHETFTVLSGRIVLELDGAEHVMEPGSVVDVAPYTRHRFRNLSDTTPATILEVSTQHFEFDSIRITCQCHTFEGDTLECELHEYLGPRK